MTGITVTPKTVQFIDDHRPSFPPGSYTVTVTQTLNQGIGTGTAEFKASRTFHVEGEQCSLNPQTIYSVFPPANSAGCYGNTFPSIILKRSTLPWERSANQPPWEEQVKASLPPPWLALLLFHEGEVDKPEVTPTKDVLEGLKELSASISRSNDPEKERVSLLNVPTELLKELVPSPKALNLLSHVRAGTHEDGTTVELAVVMGNRLPSPGINVVHLVSLENFIQEKPDAPFTRLVVLHSWEFECKAGDTQGHFKTLLTGLNVGTLKLPAKDKNNDPDLSFYLNQGYVPLKHHLRNDQTTISWYHSPLSPVKVQKPFSFDFPVRAADRLLVYHEETGLFDASYAAAWQLGRLLALQDKALSVRLFNWKRQYLQQQSMEHESQMANGSEQTSTTSEQLPESELDSIQLLFQPQQREASAIIVPQTIVNWFKNLVLLDNIPFNYLVPDLDLCPEKSLLPEESLRCFWVDRTWVECAIDGAFGIGNVLSKKSSYRVCKEKLLSAIALSEVGNPNSDSRPKIPHSTVITGFLLRSEAIAQYPSLEIAADTTEKDGCLPIRRERLSNKVMICLFEGEIRSIKINQKPEALHFSYKQKDKEDNSGGTNKFSKDSRENNGKDLRVIDVAKLEQGTHSSLSQAENAQVGSLMSSRLALELIDGSPLIEFTPINSV